MHKKLMATVFLVSAVILTIFSQQNQVVRLTVLHTNDYHGNLVPFDIMGQKQIGGMAPRSTFIKEVRKEVQKNKGNLLLLDCGDINTGTFTSDVLKAEPDIVLMNMMKYDAMTPGNHEFDLSLKDLLAQSKKANFPYLTANVFYRKSGKHIFPASHIFQIQGIKIAVFGITASDTPLISTNGHDNRILFKKPKEVIPGLLAKFQKLKVNFVISMMHMEQQKILRLARQFPEIDLILCGHNHIPMQHPLKIGKTLIAEAGSKGMMVGRFDFIFRENVLTKWSYHLVAMNLKAPIKDQTGKVLCRPYSRIFAADSAVKKILKPYLEKTKKLRERKIGTALEDIGDPNRSIPEDSFESSEMGNLVADAIREQTMADIALQNIGGVRSILLKGSICYKDVKRVLPFTNSIVTYNLTGKQILDIFQTMASGVGSNAIKSGGLMEVAGIHIRIQGTKILKATIAGKPIPLTKVYRLATNSFIANGGDGYQIFKKFPGQVKTGLYLSTLLMNYIKIHSPLKMNQEKRIIWTKIAIKKDNK